MNSIPSPLGRNGEAAGETSRLLALLLAAFGAGVILFGVHVSTNYSPFAGRSSSASYRHRDNASVLLFRVRQLSGETALAARSLTFENNPASKAELARLARELAIISRDLSQPFVIDAQRLEEIVRLGAIAKELSVCADELAGWESSSDDFTRSAGPSYLILEGYAEHLSTLAAALQTPVQSL